MCVRKPALAGVFAGLLLMLAACATPSVTVSNSVLAVQKSLQIAEQTAMIYTDLPRCGSLPARGKPICSDPELAAQMAAADAKAWDAVQKAHANEALLSGAIEAVSAYQALIAGAKR